MTDPTPTGARRAEEPVRRRSPALIVLAVVAPLIAAAAAWSAPQTAPTPTPTVAPTRAPLTNLQLTCPAGGALQLAARDTGSVALRGGAAVPTKPNVLASVTARSSVVLDARGAAAPALAATRVGPGAAIACTEPVATQWFTGVGAGVVQNSFLELINPDSGPAVVDIGLYDQSAAVDAPRLRGIVVPGGQTRRINLFRQAPTADALGMEVSVSRGRLGVSVQNLLTRPTRQVDWLAGQVTPAPVLTLLGLATGAGSRTLTVTNPGESEVQVDLQVIGPNSTFTPAGVQPLTIPPGATVATDLAATLVNAPDAIGLQLSATAPIVGSVRSLAGGGLAYLSPAEPITEGGLVVPDGDSTLTLVATRSAAAKLTAYAADGRVVGERTLTLAQQTGQRINLPARVVLVRVTTQTPDALRGAVRTTTPQGAITLPMRDLPVTSEVPALTPGG